MVAVTSLDDATDERQTRLFEGEPRVVSLSLDAGDEIPAHRHPGRTIVFHLRSGAIDLDVGPETRSLEAGDVARFDGEQPISPRAREASEALLVLSAQKD
jgi:quercetin dioxygenase-like cupin family protein